MPGGGREKGREEEKRKEEGKWACETEREKGRKKEKRKKRELLRIKGEKKEKKKRKERRMGERGTRVVCVVPKEDNVISFQQIVC
jgi:hypothetical protein